MRSVSGEGSRYCSRPERNVRPSCSRAWTRWSSRGVATWTRCISGETTHPRSYFICEERDAFELQLIRAALERETPVLAICRGVQVLNVALGGSLHSDLEDVVGDAVPHRESQTCHTYHAVKLEPDSRLAALMGATELAEVASWHHQAVDRLGAGLRAVAWAPDGTVEALELSEAPQLLAIQWHPELQIEPGSLHRRLFEAIVRMAKERP